MDEYVAAHDREMDALEAETPRANPTLAVAELRRRLEAMRRAARV